MEGKQALAASIPWTERSKALHSLSVKEEREDHIAGYLSQTEVAQARVSPLRSHMM